MQQAKCNRGERRSSDKSASEQEYTTMGEMVSDFAVKRLAAWGVRRIYGYPGDGINGLLGALDRAEGKIEFIQARHEEMAAFMACGHAKFTGEVGVCMATSGPGAIHLLNGLYDARLDHQPVVAIVGQQALKAIGSSYQQEVDLSTLFKDVAGEYVHLVADPAQARTVIDRAFRTAISERAVTCIIFTKDVQNMPYEDAPHKHGSVHTGIGYEAPRVVSDDSSLKRAAEVLNAGQKVAILVGAGALRASDEVIQVAEILGAGVAKALLGKAVVPDDLPFVTGSIGFLGTKPSYELMSQCDTLLMIGTTMPYTEFLPKEGQARGVQIDIDGRNLSIRYPMEVNLVGDSQETLKELMPLLQRKTDRSWRQQIERSITDWWKLLEERAMVEANPLNPQRVFYELSPRLPDGCIITLDSGTVALWAARHLKLRQGMMMSVSGGLASMGCGVPYAIAAKFAHPDRPVIALVGDGAMQMNGNSELLTITKYWKQWRDPRLVVLSLNNHDLSFVSWEQRLSEGNPKFSASQDLPDFPYADYARMIGFYTIRVDKPDQVAAAWDEALRADRPVLLEAVTDPSVPVLPPHITPEQTKATGALIRESAKDVLENVTP
jgi:pyruvate dehydrogenase (quinone)